MNLLMCASIIFDLIFILIAKQLISYYPINVAKEYFNMSCNFFDELCLFIMIYFFFLFLILPIFLYFLTITIG